MLLRPPRSTRTDTLFPYTTLFRSSLLRDRRDAVSYQAAFFQKRDGEWHRTNWGKFARQVSRLSRALLDNGLKKGDYVAIMGDVSQEWVVAFMATVCAGGVAVGIYFTSSTEGVDYYLEDSRSEERRVGKECVSTCRVGWSPGQ